MSNLVDLAKDLGVSPEELKRKLADLEGEEPSLDLELSPDQIERLRNEFEGSPANPLFGFFKAFIERFKRKDQAPEGTTEYQASELLESLSLEPPASTHSDQAESEDAHSSAEPKLKHLDLNPPSPLSAESREESPEKRLEDLNAEQEQSGLPLEGGSTIDPINDERTGSPIVEEPAEGPPDEPAREKNTTHAGGAPIGKAGPEELISSLESVAEIKDQLPSDVDKDDPFGLFGPEREGGETIEDSGRAATEAEQGEHQEREAEPIVPSLETESVSSEVLQSRLDRLIDENAMDPLAAPEVERKPSSFEKTLVTLTQFWNELSFRERFALAGVSLVSLVVIAGAVTWNARQFGEGGDIRFYRAGVGELSSGDLDGANDSFEKILKRYPWSPLISETRMRIAEIENHQGDYTEAARNMMEGLRLLKQQVADVTGEWTENTQKKRTDGLFFLAEVNRSKKDWEAAAEWYQAVIQETSDSSLVGKARYRYADALYQGGLPKETKTQRLRDTVKAYEKALEESPQSELAPEAKLHLARTWERLAERETGVRNENLGKALSQYTDLRNLGQGVQSAGLTPLEMDLEVGRVRREIGRIEESVDLYRDLLTEDRDEYVEGPLPYAVSFGLARSLLERAEIHLDEAREASAEADLFEVLERTRERNEFPFSEEELTEAVYLRGHANYQLGVLELLRAGDPQNAYYARMESAYQSALRRDPEYGKNGVDSLLAMLRRTNYQYENNQEYRAAVQAYRKILDAFPQNIYAYRVRYKLGVAHFELGEYEEAEEQFREAVQSFPRTRYADDAAFRDSYFKLGATQFLQGKYGETAQTYRTLLSLIKYENSPEALLAWRRLAESYYKLGRIDEAIDERRQYLEKYPEEDKEGLVRFALARDLLARYDYEAGRQELEKIIANRPYSEAARWGRYLLCDSFLRQSVSAVGQEREGLLRQALTTAEEIRIGYPDEDKPLALTGRIFYELEDYARAARDLEYYQQSARNRSPDAEYQFRLAESYYRLQDYDKAAANYKKIRLDKLSRDDQSRVLYHLAESLRYIGRNAEAIQAYQDLLEEFPTSTERELAEGRIRELNWRISKGL